MTQLVNGDGGVGDKLEDGAANYHDDSATVVLMGDGFVNGPKDKESSKSSDGEFVGLRKEELARYATDPYWVRMRIILLIIFAGLWIAMLVAAIVIIVLAPRCPPRPTNQQWWEKAVIYQIHPLSFQDSFRDDGYGDIKGIHDRLGYLKDELKVDAVALGPIYPSKFEDDGYDITLHNQTCLGHYGSEPDFNSLRAALHKAGIKLILDFIPNHTHKKHWWFQESMNASGDPTFKDFYIWSDGISGQPPNNLKSVRGGSAWTWSEERQQYYYHTFSETEPDLNLRNPNVTATLDRALTIWLEKKVDGFTVRDAEYLYEPVNIQDSAVSDVAFQPESYELIARWRKIMDDFTQEESKSKSRKTSRVLIADVSGNPKQTVQFYGCTNKEEQQCKPGANLATNKVLVALNESCDSQCILDHIKSWMSVAANITSNWQSSNVDVSRVATRYKSGKYVNAINLLTMTLGGTAMSLYGEELGMTDGPSSNTTSSRPQLTPMQWNNSQNAGFTRPQARPWKPIAKDYHLTSLQTQQAHGSGVNHFGVYQRMVELRSRSESLQWGALKGVTVQGGVLMYMREAEGFNRLLVAINFGPDSSTVDFLDYKRNNFEDGRRLPEEMTIVSSTFNFEGADRVNDYNNGTKIKPERMIYLKPTEGVVLSWPPSADRKY